ncbi:MAG: peptide ABC transporter substrate-binding protein, partial [Gaiellales bacterium]
MSVKFKKLVASMSLVVMAALVAVGCGGDGKGGDKADLADTQELVVQIGDETEAGVFDPVMTSYLDTVNRNNSMFAGLYRYNNDASELVPYLATDLPDISEDGLTYIVKLRDNAKWSDGKDLTAKDLVFGVQHALDPATEAYFAGFMLDIVGACEYNAGSAAKAKKNCSGENLTDGKPESIGVTATDDHTVEFKLNRQVPWFDQLLTLQTIVPLRQDVIEKHGKDWVKPENIVTSGPFTLTSYKPKSEIVVEKDDNFWDADNIELDKITFRMIPEATTAFRDFERKKIDMAFPRTAINTADIDQVKTEDYYVSSDSTETQYAYLNTRNDYLSDPKVRQALSLAVDRVSIVENVSKRGDRPSGTIVPSGIPGYDVMESGAQDFIDPENGPQVDKAKQLLEEGGWDKKQTLKIYYSSDSGNAQGNAEQIQSDWADIGVKAELKPTSGDVLSTQGYGISPVKPEVDVLLQGWVQDYLDGQNWYQLFTCANVDAGLNGSNFCDKEYDELYKEALTTVDNDACYEIYKQL